MAVIRNPINREATGFLDLLRAKVGGQGPDKFDNEVKTVIDVTRYISASKMRIASTATSSTAGTANYALSLTQPDDEAWLVHSINLMVHTVNVAAAGYNIGTITARNQRNAKGSTGGLAYLKPYESVKATAATPSMGGATWIPSEPTIFPPGTIYGGYRYLADGTVSWTYTLNIVITEMKV